MSAWNRIDFDFAYDERQNQHLPTFCFLEKQGARNMLSDASCSDDESLLLVWDDERAAKFAASEKKNHSKAHEQRETVCP
ncbi:MAG: hypothetical protein M3299_15750 [Thermoproteota archaeon]|nr:hypothetical protein [Thermoproteota archaeon]